MKKHILVLEDDESISYLLEEVITDLGYFVEITSTKEAFEEKVTDFNPELILMDVTLKGERVDKTIAHIKNDSHTAHIPVILISGVNDLDEVMKQTGADAAFAKPFDIEELEQYIQDRLS